MTFSRRCEGHMKGKVHLSNKKTYHQVYDSSIFHFFNSIIQISGLEFLSCKGEGSFEVSWTQLPTQSISEVERQLWHTAWSGYSRNNSIRKWMGKLCLVHQNFMWEIVRFKVECCFVRLSWRVPLPSLISLINTELLLETLRLSVNPHTRTQAHC